MRHLHGIVAGVIACASVVLHAEEVAFESPDSLDETSWQCRYAVTRDGMWVVRCLELNQVLRSEPTVEDGNAYEEVEVPIYGPPVADSDTGELVRAVLCRHSQSCDIRLAALHANYR